MSSKERHHTKPTGFFFWGERSKRPNQFLFFFAKSRQRKPVVCRSSPNNCTFIGTGLFGPVAIGTGNKLTANFKLNELSDFFFSPGDMSAPSTLDSEIERFLSFYFFLNIFEDSWRTRDI